jgi:hypothetical protein
MPMLLIVLIVILVVATGVGYLQTSGGATNYACMSISHQGSDVKVTTVGLVHYLKQQYYITCDEGANLPANTFTSSCLTITSQAVPSSIGFGAGTSYYYLSTTGHAVTLVGAPAPTNGTEIITPSSISLSVSC